MSRARRQQRNLAASSRRWFFEHHVLARAERVSAAAKCACGGGQMDTQSSCGISASMVSMP